MDRTTGCGGGFFSKSVKASLGLAHSSQAMRTKNSWQSLRRQGRNIKFRGKSEFGRAEEEQGGQQGLGGGGHRPTLAGFGLHHPRTEESGEGL